MIRSKSCAEHPRILGTIVIILSPRRPTTLDLCTPEMEYQICKRFLYKWNISLNFVSDRVWLWISPSLCARRSMSLYYMKSELLLQVWGQPLISNERTKVSLRFTSSQNTSEVSLDFSFSTAQLRINIASFRWYYSSKMSSIHNSNALHGQDSCFILLQLILYAPKVYLILAIIRKLLFFAESTTVY